MGCIGGKEAPPKKTNQADTPPAAPKSFGPFKLVVMGDFTTGKTAILVREAMGQFLEDTAKDFKDKHDKTYNINGGTAKVVFHDTAGQEQYNVVTSSIYENAHCQLVVFDVTNEESFKELANHLRQGKEYASPGRVQNPVRALLANKIDLASERKVDHSKAEAFAQENDMLFAEVSAKSGDGITQIFQAIAQKLAETTF